jgi:hypothetical protein
MQSIIIKLREILRSKNNKGLVHRPLIMSTNKPDNDPDFNEVFEHIYKELRK